MSTSTHKPSVKKSRPIADYLGIGSATLCLIHCLATPVLMLMGVTLHEHHEGHVHAHGWEMLLGHSWDFLFLGIGFVAVFWSSQHTQHTGRKVLLWLSFLFLAGAILLEHASSIFQYLTYFASVLLILAHVSNIRAIVTGRRADLVCVSEGCTTE